MIKKWLLALVILLAGPSLIACDSNNPQTKPLAAHLKDSQMAFIYVDIGNDMYEAISQKVVLVDEDNQIVNYDQTNITGLIDTSEVGEYTVTITIQAPDSETAVIPLTVTVTDPTLTDEEWWPFLDGTFWVNKTGNDGWYLSFLDDDNGGDVIQFASIKSDRYLWEAAVEDLPTVSKKTYTLTGTANWYDQKEEKVKSSGQYELVMTIADKNSTEMTVKLTIANDYSGHSGQTNTYILTGRSYDSVLQYY